LLGFRTGLVRHQSGTSPKHQSSPPVQSIPRTDGLAFVPKFAHVSFVQHTYVSDVRVCTCALRNIIIEKCAIQQFSLLTILRTAYCAIFYFAATVTAKISLSRFIIHYYYFYFHFLFIYTIRKPIFCLMSTANHYVFGL
jgi:hypothetical protein